MRGSAAFLGLLAAGWTAGGAAGAVRLAPHKAVYDLRLLSSHGPRTIGAARGRIVFDFTGSACDGYALSLRQVTVVEADESDPRLSDLRTTTFEEGEGGGFKFRTETQVGAGPAKVVNGDAEKRGEGLVVRLARPKRERIRAGTDVIFPTAHMKRLIEAAQTGETLLSARVFDGSDDGRKIYDTLSIVGRKIEPGASAGLEDAARKSGLDKLARWPVTISYFTPGAGERTPIYVLVFDLFENGVSGALRLDYGDFALKGEMKRLDLLPVSSCER